MNGLRIGAVLIANAPGSRPPVPDAAATVDAVVAGEEAGLDTAWLSLAYSAPDTLATFAAAALRTARIELGTSIYPTFPRHPVATAQLALAVDQLAPGRLRLGVGPGHGPTVQGELGVPFERPLQYHREYLTILNALLKTGSVDFDGERLHAHVRFGAPTGVRVLSSALRTNAFRLCGELTDGALSGTTPVTYLRSVAVPALREGAAKAGRPVPPLIAHVAVVVSTDTAAVMEAAFRQFAIYPGFPFYSRMLQDAGFPEAKEGRVSERMAQALMIHGDEENVAAQIRGLGGGGIDELRAVILRPRGDESAFARTLALLGRLARNP